SPQMAAKSTNLGVHGLQKLGEEFSGKLKEKQEQLPKAEARLAAVQQDKELLEQTRQLQNEATEAQARLTAETRALNSYRELVRTHGPRTLQVLAGVFLVLSVLTLVGGLRRGVRPQA